MYLLINSKERKLQQMKSNEINEEAEDIHEENIFKKRPEPKKEYSIFKLVKELQRNK
jgi:hypothetical protein